MAEKTGHEIDRDSLFYQFLQQEAVRVRNVAFFGTDIKEILLMLEGRRKSRSTNVATIMAALAGGMIGAILGASVSFILNTSAPKQPKTSKNVEILGGVEHDELFQRWMKLQQIK